MEVEPEVLMLSFSAFPDRQQSFHVIAGVLSALLPWAEIEHVGSTAVPGCLTKGDLDVLVRVYRADFQRSARILDDLLVSSTRNETTDDYAEFDCSLDGVSASVQLAVAGSTLDDHFHRLKMILKSNPDALDQYNSLKARHDGGGMSKYRIAKERLIDSLLEGDSVANDRSGEVVLRPGIHG